MTGERKKASPPLGILHQPVVLLAALGSSGTSRRAQDVQLLTKGRPDHEEREAQDDGAVEHGHLTKRDFRHGALTSTAQYTMDA